jgi:hypothetical protein
VKEKGPGCFPGPFFVSFLIVANGGELIGTLDFFCFHGFMGNLGLTGFLWISRAFASLRPSGFAQAYGSAVRFAAYRRGAKAPLYLRDNGNDGSAKQSRQRRGKQTTRKQKATTTAARS